MSSAQILAIETSVETGSVALLDHKEVREELEFFAGRKPSSGLWPALEGLFPRVSDLSAVVVGLGPGSYNGARIGIAAAQGIALVQNCPVIGLSSFEGVRLEGREAIAIGDARRGSYSIQVLAHQRPQGIPSLVSKNELIDTIQEAIRTDREVFCFENIQRFQLPEGLQQHVIRRESKASQLGRAYQERSATEKAILAEHVVEPRYLRDPHITSSKRGSLLERSEPLS